MSGRHNNGLVLLGVVFVFLSVLTSVGCQGVVAEFGFRACVRYNKKSRPLAYRQQARAEKKTKTNTRKWTTLRRRGTLVAFYVCSAICGSVFLSPSVYFYFSGGIRSPFLSVKKAKVVRMGRGIRHEAP